jgi:hypothetical protein
MGGGGIRAWMFVHDWIRPWERMIDNLFMSKVI